jgi:histone acetyltransferase (RNA polymerase elongator complex component)
MSYKILPLFIPFSGCKNICLYCNQKNITGQLGRNILNNIKEQLQYYLDKNIKWTEIAIYGGTFTGLEKLTQVNTLKYISKLFPELPIRVSTRPDSINTECLVLLKGYNVKTIELGIQSFSEKVLTSNKRYYSEDIIIESMSSILEHSFVLGVQIMCGLFNEQVDDYIYTVDRLKKLTFNYVRIYPTIVIKDSQLEKLYLENKYTPLTLSEAISYSAYGYIKFTASGKTVIRMGLQNSYLLEKSIVSGPYHKSFGDLVKIYVLYLYLLNVDKVYIGINDKSLIFGYSRFIHKLFNEKIIIDDNCKIDWLEICRVLNNEDNLWILKEQKNIFEKKFFN